MFLVDKISSSSAESLAGFTSNKRWQNMENEGARMAQIAANICLCYKWLRDHILVCPGCAWSIADSPLSASTPNLVRKKHQCPSVCRQKTSGLGQGQRRLMQAMECGFQGVGYAIRLDESFWCAKISQKMLNSQMCWAWGRGAPNQAREGRIPEIDSPKTFSAPCMIYWWFVLCLSECDPREICGILDHA